MHHNWRLTAFRTPWGPLVCVASDEMRTWKFQVKQWNWAVLEGGRWQWLCDGSGCG